MGWGSRATAMSDELVQYIILAAFGALCFGFGYVVAFFIERTAGATK